MKFCHVVVLSFMLTAGQGAALGQASFSLNNVNVDAPVFDAGGSPLYGADYLVELWGGSASDELSPALTFETSQRIIIAVDYAPGYFLDSYDGRSGTDDLVIPSAPFGGYAWLEVRAWDARLGATYEEVESLGIGGYGESPLFYALGSTPGQLLPSIPADLVGLESFNLRPIVPEPSTGLLFPLGGVLGWWVRRCWAGPTRHLLRTTDISSTDLASRRRHRLA